MRLRVTGHDSKRSFHLAILHLSIGNNVHGIGENPPQTTSLVETGIPPRILPGPPLASTPSSRPLKLEPTNFGSERTLKLYPN